MWQTVQPNYLTLAQEYYSILIPALVLILIFCVIKSSLTFRDANCLFFFPPSLSLMSLGSSLQIKFNWPPFPDDSDCRRLGFSPWVWKIPQEEGMATYSSLLAWRIPWTGGTWWTVVHGVAKSWTHLSDFNFHFQL